MKATEAVMSETRPRRGTAPDTAMVLAAGLGTRMRAHNGQAPKPLVRVGGKALIDHVLDRLADAGVARAVVNVHHLADQIEQHLQARQQPGIVISDERHELLAPARRRQGAGTARRRAVLPCQFRYDLDRRREAQSGAAGAAFEPDRMDALLLLAPTATSTAMRAAAISRCGRRPLAWRGEREVCRSSMRAPPSWPRHCLPARRRRFPLTDLWRRAAEAERLYGLRLEGVWMHVGTPEAVAAAKPRSWRARRSANRPKHSRHDALAFH